MVPVPEHIFMAFIGPFDTFLLSMMARGENLTRKTRYDRCVLCGVFVRKIISPVSSGLEM